VSLVLPFYGCSLERNFRGLDVTLKIVGVNEGWSKVSGKYFQCELSPPGRLRVVDHSRFALKNMQAVCLP